MWEDLLAVCERDGRSLNRSYTALMTKTSEVSYPGVSGIMDLFFACLFSLRVCSFSSESSYSIFWIRDYKLFDIMSLCCCGAKFSSMERRNDLFEVLTKEFFFVPW